MLENYLPQILAVDSRHSEDAAASELNEDVLREAVLCLSQEGRDLTEKSLVRKLDARMSILVLIYILNYVSDMCYVRL